jgi:ATP-dependent DNA helicase RecG
LLGFRPFETSPSPRYTPCTASTRVSLRMTPDTPLADLPLIKPAQQNKLAHLGMVTLFDLLLHFPSRYEDYSHTLPLSEAAPGMQATFAGTLTQFSVQRSFKQGMLITSATLTDDSGSLRLIWFNQKFIGQMLSQGMEIRVSGKVTADKQGLVLVSPAFERASRDATHTARLVPVYPETLGITSKYLRYLIALIFKKLEAIPDPLPEKLLDKLHLPSLHRALFDIHFPKNTEVALIAKKRFAFDEMFLLQLKALEMRALYQGAHATPIPRHPSETRAFLSLFPFVLTRAQEAAVNSILADLALNRPMNRLLNGDVGSGKTAVAATALHATALSGHQGALLAPTEVLARQHFESLSRLFAHTPFQVALYTKSYQILDSEKVSKKTLLSALKAGIPSLVIGTHALLEDQVSFRSLALIVVDEQHRFGVSQRAKLQEQSFQSDDGQALAVPHFLAMTATPIPRTLAIACFGNLDISLLNEMPKNRKPIITKIARNEADRKKIEDFIRHEVKQGHQAFIIFPLVETSLALKDVKAAIAEHEKLEKEIFPDLRIGLLHGRMKSQEKETIMRAFTERAFDILVATSVVEVGIDIPNATVIVIEEADRFGLSQLHQFRGRVGRGEAQSYCFLIAGEHAALENARLEALEKSSDGFALAEIDLALRGPGSFFGTRQSGLPDVAMESLTNVKLISLARAEAELLLAADPHLEQHPLLRHSLTRFTNRVHLE